MINIVQVVECCVEVLDGMPVFPHDLRLKGPDGGRPPSPGEIFAYIMDLNFAHRDEVDRVIAALVLDRHVVETEPVIWRLIEHRIRAAVYFLSLLSSTLRSEESMNLSIDDQDYGLAWALGGLWKIAGPVWVTRAAQLIAHNKPLSYEGSTSELI